MDVFNQYDIFKEKCFGFSEKFEKNCFSQAKLVCHPTVENEIISLCSDEEAKSNGLNICRFSDMLLMSDDNENWNTFNLAEARQIAEENGYVYLTDLLAEDAFYAEDWMINGKNDTIVVSEEYMREKGKRYAPVTPLTNKVLHFKKIKNSFFWTKSEIGEIKALDADGIKARLDTYFNECVENIPLLISDDDIEFALFDGKVVINTNTTRALKTDVFFEQINNILGVFDGINEILDIAGYSFSPVDFIIDVAVTALKNNGLNITRESFVNDFYNPIIEKEPAEINDMLSIIAIRNENSKIDCVKLAFINVLKKQADFEFNYPASESSEYYKDMRNLEQTDFNGTVGAGEEKYLITSILSHKPADYAIFAYILRRYPEESNNAARIAEFWGIEPISEDELQNKIFSSYLNDELFDENGNFNSGLDQAQIIKEQLEKVNEKYHFENTNYMNELNDYIKDVDLKRRTYNGTVFDTPDDMKRAMANELELQALCVDLSALDESELIDLRKHINGITVDEATKSKYLVKVKIALNRVEESMLDQLCLDLPMLDADDTIVLRNNVLKTNYAESVVRPKLAEINDHLNSALHTELDKLYAKLDGMTKEETLKVIDAMKSDRYPKVLSESYVRKAEEYAENKIKAEIESICNGMDNFDMTRLADAKAKLSSDKYPEKYTASLISEINALMSEYEQREVEKLFENIDFATADELNNIKSTVAAKNYPENLIAPYLPKISQREQAILDDELVSMCSGIEEMAQEQLDKLKDEINNTDKKYNDDLKARFLEKIERRECELKNTELAELCKYIFSMEQDKLDELKDVLLSDKYDESLTTIYLKKVTEREDELRRIELDKLCENINELSEEELNKLKDDIKNNDKYVAICDGYIEKIDNCIENIKYAEFNKLLDTVAEMDSDSLAKFREDMAARRNELGDELYQRSVVKADERADAIEIEELDAIVADIDNFDVDKTNAAINLVTAGSFKEEHKTDYINKLNEKLEQLYIAGLDSITADISSSNKAQLNEMKNKVNDYNCPAELKSSYIYNIEKQITELADKEVRDLCGNISTLSVKRALDTIVKIRTMSLDDNIKNQYLDAIEAHIMELKNNEQKEYIDCLKQKINEFNVSTVSFLVPTISNLFYQKYDEACQKYVSVGRYELPIFLHDSSSDSGFTLTTEYFYFINKGVINRIKIDDLVSFQAKKSLMATAIIVAERNGNTSEIPCSINKNSIEATAKAMTALINYIRDKRAEEHMKELIETAAVERSNEVKAEEEKQAAAPVTAAETSEAAVSEEAPDESKPRFCDQCGARIASSTAKFCAECGNRLN